MIEFLFILSVEPGKNDIMNKMIQDTNMVIQEPEVQEMLKRLSVYGLGIFMPHMHTAKGDFVPLPDDMIQVENNLQVSFQPRSKAVGSAVGWIWSNQAMAIAVCSVCVPEPNGGHAYASTVHKPILPIEPDEPKQDPRPNK